MSNFSGEIIDYGIIDNSLIYEIFGDEMTYDNLSVYAARLEGSTHLVVEWYSNTDTQHLRVWFNNVFVMDREFSIDHDCRIIYFLHILRFRSVLP